MYRVKWIYKDLETEEFCTEEQTQNFKSLNKALAFYKLKSSYTKEEALKQYKKRLSNSQRIIFPYFCYPVVWIEECNLKEKKIIQHNQFDGCTL